LVHPIDDRGLGPAVMQPSPSWFRLLAAPGVFVLALVTCLSSAAYDFSGMPADLPIGEIKSVTPDWRPHLCRRSDRQKVICAIEAFLACTTFYRIDLCERVGIYPSVVPQDEYDLYGEGDTNPFGPGPAVEQYRLLEFRSLDARYAPPLLLVHMESRTCYRTGPPPQCSVWWSEYAIISHLDTATPEIAAAGALELPP
jgi:hypothetical protein